MLQSESFEPLCSPVSDPEPDALYLVFAGDGLLATAVDASTPGPARLPQGAETPPLDPASLRLIGRLAGRACYAARALDLPAPPGWRYEPLRHWLGGMPEAHLALAGRARQILEFERTHRFCGACGTPNEPAEGGRARRCPACGELAFPRLTPAMMVLLQREGAHGRELLLAHGVRFVSGIYGALAGFVEPGESLEDCVRRETFEEVGLRIRNLRYFGSQNWPFPHSLMIAFVADWAAGEIVCQEDEIDDAQWFPIDALPELPPRESIARRLIDAVAAGWPQAQA